MKAAVAEKAAEAKKAVATATTEPDVEAAKNAGLEGIAFVYAGPVAQEAMYANANAQKATIDGMKNLSQEEKDDLKKQIDDAYAAGKAAVEAATTTDGVDAAKKAYDDSVALTMEKAKQLDDMTGNANARKAAIDALPNLTDEEKGNYKAAIDKALADAKDAVNGAATVEAARDAGAAAYQALTAQQQAKANAMILAANGNVSGAPTSYPAFKAAVEKFADASSDSFITKYLTDKNGNVVKDTTTETIDTILDDKAVAAWESMSQAEKDAVDAKLKAKGGKSYTEMLATAQAAEKAVKDFLDAYVSDKDGNLYTKATSKNYNQIISGSKPWDNLTQLQKDLVNGALIDNGGVTYPKLLSSANAIYKELHPTPKTGDTANAGLWAGLLLTSVAALVVVVVRKRKYN